MLQVTDKQGRVLGHTKYQYYNIEEAKVRIFEFTDKIFFLYPYGLFEIPSSHCARRFLPYKSSSLTRLSSRD
jgi:hypothetical protein